MAIKYKWLASLNLWTNEYNQERSCLEDMPEAWANTFGDQMVEELNEILVKYNLVDTYHITQVKEKFGGLRWYDEGITTEAWDEYYVWLRKYENLSEETCAICGDKGTLRTDIGWILPLCEEHYKEYKYEKRK